VGTYRSAAVIRALRAAPVAGLAGVLAEAATATFGAGAVQLLLPDYRLSVLLTVERVPELRDAEPLAIDRTPQGRVFSSQQPVLEQSPVRVGWRLLLPVTVRGHRLGVLSAEFPERPTDEVRADLAEVAEALAHELLVAEAGTDLYRRNRRVGRLTLAAEMQWDTLPGREVVTERYAFAGQLEPAYAICGDTFDWSCDPDGLTVAVLNGTSEGMAAALLTTFTVAALRNARRSGATLREQAELASDLLHTQHAGKHHLAALLFRYDVAGGLLEVVEAGSPQLLLLRGGSLEAVKLNGQLPLGMVEDASYPTEQVPVRPGDRLVVVSDGVHAASDPAGAAYGRNGLGRVLRRTRLQPPGEVVRSVLRDAVTHHGSGLDDDGVVVCLDIR
jgi:serine phosphatase RsbU (regulator of sigma subunit)